MHYGFLIATIEIFLVVTTLLIKFSPRVSERAFSDHINQGTPYYSYLVAGFIYIMLSLGTFLSDNFSVIVKCLWIVISISYIILITIPRRGKFIQLHDIAAKLTGSLLLLESLILLVVGTYSLLVTTITIFSLIGLSYLAYRIEVKRTEKTKYLYFQTTYFYLIHIVLIMLVYFTV